MTPGRGSGKNRLTTAACVPAHLVFQGSWTPGGAAREALRVLRGRGGITAEDSSAFRNFAQDMQKGAASHLSCHATPGYC
jgi:hypothetical protein